MGFVGEAAGMEPSSYGTFRVGRRMMGRSHIVIAALVSFVVLGLVLTALTVTSGQDDPVREMLKSYYDPMNILGQDQFKDDYDANLASRHATYDHMNLGDDRSHFKAKAGVTIEGYHVPVSMDERIADDAAGVAGDDNSEYPEKHMLKSATSALKSAQAQYDALLQN